MLVGVCCECQQGRKPLRYERGRALIDSHDAFGYFCQGSGQVPQATYQDSSGPDQMPEGVVELIGNGLPIVKDRIQEDQFEREEHEREQAKEAEKLVCCFDPWRSTVVDRETNVSRNHRPDPPKPPGIFGTIGDILLAAKNGNKGKRKKGT